ncbi:hypothetical protein Syun_015043 [Stephania yunnanensis]|uniref:Uncharacterized protein n=1 Tax=Stephania yunnanensis TaxID=152371 RepID=A0AAP0P919_9MAGN
MDMAPAMNNITNAYDHQYINIEDGVIQSSCEEAMPPLMIIDQDHPSAVPFIATDDNDCEVLEEEGLDWLRDFPKFQPADLEFSDWEANAWDNEFAPV